MQKWKACSFFVLIVLVACGENSKPDSTPKDISNVEYMPDESILTPSSDQVISQFVDAIVAGVPYVSTSGAGAIYEGKTNLAGQFISFPEGVTEFKIGSVNLGSWHEPTAPPNSAGGSIVQLTKLSFGQVACASLDAVTTARILLSLSTHQNYFFLTIPEGSTLHGCPQDANFFTQNSLDVTVPQASTHIATTASRIDAQKQIAALLFNIAFADIDKDSSGANYFYSNYGSGVEGGTTCEGYAGGHAGVDFQTKDVVGSATANRNVYFLTDGKVVFIDHVKGRVIVQTSILVNGVNESVKIGYLHLRAIDVATNDIVVRGSKIGIQGNKGLNLSDTTTYEHVHVEIRSTDAPLGAACGAAPAVHVGSLDPLNYFISIIGVTTPKWVARMTTGGAVQKLEFESFLPEGQFVAQGRETLGWGDCTISSELNISGTKKASSIQLIVTTTTPEQFCAGPSAGVHTATIGFERNYVGELVGTDINILAVDQCDFLGISPFPNGCFNFSAFAKE